MSEEYKDLEKFLSSNNKRTYLEECVFDMLNKIKSSDDKAFIIKQFIRFIEQYQQDIIAGRANETILVGGKYEAVEKVEKISWEKIVAAVEKYESETDNLVLDEENEEDMEIDDSDEYTEDEDEVDEGGD